MDLSQLGRRLSDIEAEFNFEELPDDGFPSQAPEADDIDAVNDETFGGLGMPVNAELEDYATQTACLDWEQPGCSAGAPDASQLPMPAFDFGFGADSAFSAFAPPRNGSNTDHLNKIDSLWNNTSSSDGVFNLWGGASTSQKDPSLGSFGEVFTTDRYVPEVVRPPVVVPGEIGRPPPMPLQAQTLDDLERAYVDTSKPVNLNMGLPPGAISAEELERSMVASKDDSPQKPKQQTSPTRTAGVHQQQQPAGPFPPMGGPMPPMGMPPGPGGPGFFPPVPPMMMPFMAGWMDFLSGKIPYLPPNFPPVPPPLVMMFRQMKMRPPPPGMQHGGPGMQPPMNPMMPPMHSPAMSNHSDWQRRPYNRKVVPGMPSGKTIEDFAFDPFAGYMSCKEREWLVKIQILQCQGSGDPYADDYYYACWRDKQLAGGWKPESKPAPAPSERGERGREYRERTPLREHNRNGKNDDREKREYRAPNFAGSLGKPVTSTVYNPRHLIDVRGDPEDDPSKKPATQKKLRTMLLKLESAALLLITCADLRRQVAQSPQLADQVETEVATNVELIVKELYTSEHITKTLQLSKGRAILRRLLSVCGVQDQMRIVVTLFECVSVFHKKGLQELSTDVAPALNRVLTRLSREDLISLIARLNADGITASIGEKNSLCRDLLCTLLLWCSRRKATSAHPLFKWLKATGDPTTWDGAGWSHSLCVWTSALSLAREDAGTFADWLKFLCADPRAETNASTLSIGILSSFS